MWNGQCIHLDKVFKGLILEQEGGIYHSRIAGIKHWELIKEFHLAYCKGKNTSRLAREYDFFKESLRHRIHNKPINMKQGGIKDGENQSKSNKNFTHFKFDNKYVRSYWSGVFSL
jgi:hypothetical protein